MSRKLGEELTLNREYLEHVRFDGDDSTAALKTIAQKYKLWVFDSRAIPDNADQAMYAKSAPRQIYKWNGQINEFPRMCAKVQDRYAARHLQREKDGMVLLTETQSKRIAAEILSVVEDTDKKADHKMVKELLSTYQNSSTDV